MVLINSTKAVLLFCERICRNTVQHVLFSGLFVFFAKAWLSLTLFDFYSYCCKLFHVPNASLNSKGKLMLKHHIHMSQTLYAIQEKGTTFRNPISALLDPLLSETFSLFDHINMYECFCLTKCFLNILHMVPSRT